jgi:RNA polymerase sigma factor (sigma-70 family)
VIRELTDGQLLERFARGDGPAAELAFAALVERHGAMVIRVCRAHLADPHDRQDAFQATLLVLVEKARGLWVRDSLGPWLHQVALRTASRARAAAIRRKRLEQRAAEIMASRDHHEDTGDPELARVLHEEIERLPERYRVPIVLCDLEGRTCEEAARVMGRPVGTIKCWRSRGRERLRVRLIRVGLAPSVAAGAALRADAARSAVAAPAADQAARAAIRILADGIGAGVVPASVSMLVKGVMRSMFLNQLRTATVGFCVLMLIGSGLLRVARVAAEDPNRTAAAPPGAGSPRASGLQPPTVMTKPPELGGEAWLMSLREAIRIGLGDNPQFVRVVSPEAEDKPAGGVEPAAMGATPNPRRTGAGVSPIVITRVDLGAAPSRFKSEMMAHVRSVEQQYWNLNTAYTRLWATREVVALAEAAVKREQEGTRGGRGSDGESADARLRLEQLRLDLVTRTSDAITVEQLLRNLLGLPYADNRRIVPITPPTEGRLEPDWDTCRAAMLEKQPDIVQARELVSQAEGVVPAPPPIPAAGTGERTKLIERQKANLWQVIRETTHSLGRFFLEIDASYKQFRTASQVRAAAGERLEAQRAEYEAGRIPAERFFDAVAQYTAAVASEAQYKATYNISMAAVEEAKGTLLEFDKIIVTDAPEGKNASQVARSDGAVKPASHQPEPLGPAPVSPGGPAAPTRATDETAKPDSAGKTYSFHLTIGSGPRPFEIPGSFIVAPAREKQATGAGAR